MPRGEITGVELLTRLAAIRSKAFVATVENGIVEAHAADPEQLLAQIL